MLRLQHSTAYSCSRWPTCSIRRARPLTRTRAGKDDDDAAPSTSYNVLEATIKRKQRQVEMQLKELGEDGLEERMQSSVQTPANPSYRLARLIAETTERQGRAVLVVEVTRPSPSATPEDLAAVARSVVAMGADAVVVRTDSEATSSGLRDLFAVCQAVRVPVLARDWYIHPLQIVEAKEAGAAGVIGVVAQVNGRGTGVMSSFAAAIGLDAPVEVVNIAEVAGLSKAGVVFYGINLGVGISIAIPGFARDIANGLLGELPFGALSLVGVRSVEDARKARLSGADSLLVKKELIDEAQASGADMRTLMDQLQYVTGGDD